MPDSLDVVDDAIRRGDLAALRRALGDPPEFPDVRDASGTWCLVAAIYHGPPALVESLLAAGANPHPPVDDGFPTLLAAIDRHAPDRGQVLRSLLTAGADVQQRGINDYTPLHHAACRDDAESVAILLAHGADPHARTRIDGYATPIEEAETFGHRIGTAALREAMRAPRNVPPGTI